MDKKYSVGVVGCQTVRQRLAEQMIETFELPEIPKLSDGRCDNDKTDVKSDVLEQDSFYSKHLRNLQAFGLSYTRYSDGKKIEIMPSMEPVYNQSDFLEQHLKLFGITNYDSLYDVKNTKSKEEQQREFESRILLDRIHKLPKLAVYDRYRETLQGKLE